MSGEADAGGITRLSRRTLESGRVLHEVLARLLKNDDSSVGARAWFLWAPVLVSCVAFGLSLASDLSHPGKHWVALSGAIIALCRAVSSYGGAVRIWIRRGEMIRGVYSEIPHGKVGLMLGLIGTVPWGYGDLWL